MAEIIEFPLDRIVAGATERAWLFARVVREGNCLPIFGKTEITEWDWPEDCSSKSILRPA